MASQGKISRMPLAVREEVNRRLLDNQAGRVILEWLNVQPEAQRICTERFAGEPVSDSNLTHYRQRDYAKWLERRDRLESSKALAKYAMSQTKAAGGNVLSEAASSIAAGYFLELTELLTSPHAEEEAGAGENRVPTAERLKQIAFCVENLTALRAGDNAQARTELDARKVAQGAEALQFEKWKWMERGAEGALKLLQNTEAQRVASEPGDNAAKIDYLGQAMFGELWTEAKKAERRKLKAES